jgi:hypothetical protein
MRRNLNRIDFEEKPTGGPAATTPDSPASPLE